MSDKDLNKAEGDHQTGLIPTESPRVSRLEAPPTGRPPWLYFLESLTGQVPPWDRGVLDAHYINGDMTERIRARLEKARSGRRGVLAFLSPWRRRYLDGYIWTLEKEMERRSRQH